MLVVGVKPPKLRRPPMVECGREEILEIDAAS